MTRWRAQTARSDISGLILCMVPISALIGGISILWSGLTLGNIGAVIVILAASGAATAWAYKNHKALLELSLEGDVLTIVGRGPHRLTSGSLSAVRARENIVSGNVMGTYVIVALPTGPPIILLFATIVDSALYFADRELKADAWLGPDGNALLERITPSLARADGSAPKGPPRYVMALRRNALAPSCSVDSLSIVGDSLALGKDGAVVAEARVCEVAFTPFAFKRTQSVTGPTFPRAPGLIVELPSQKLTLSIGAHPMSLVGHWGDLPESGAPDFLVGLGELLRLWQVLEAGRSR